jgi:hypothetical protein
MKKLREYKGVAYSPAANMWIHPKGQGFTRAASIIISDDLDLTDADHLHLMALKADPYEPVVTLERVVHAWHSDMQSRGFMGGFIRAAEIAELCSRLRNAFPHIDQEER